MKIQLRYWLALTALLCCVVAIYPRILAQSSGGGVGLQPATAANPQAAGQSGGANHGEPGGRSPDDQIRRMDLEIGRIVSRLGVSAPMEADPAIQEGLIEEKFISGFIVEATLEEVETAIAAAEATPDMGDDIDAQVLKHRGSYRFFAPE